MSEMELVCGIETHVQLDTKSKLFCGCRTTFGSPPNTQVCPVCSGQPGVLPVLNRRAFDLALRAATALEATLADRTKFDRKNYFYPDLPKGYQISQYDMPFSTDGQVELSTGKKIRLIRIHLEEDAGKLVHEGKDSRVDLNRAGMPLIEIVTHPDISSPEEAHEYLTKLRHVMQWIGVSDCDMEKGELRCDINMSVRPKGTRKLGVKIEVKNLNSFRYAKDALAYEYERQVKVLAEGGVLRQETRLFDNEKGVTKVMRTKEEAHDYRYFPEPDLPPIVITAEWKDEVRNAMPELPDRRRARFREKYGLSDYDAGVLTGSTAIADYFEAAAKLHDDAKKAANWVANDLMKVLNDEKMEIEDLKLKPKQLVELIRLVDEKKITGAVARDMLPDLVRNPRTPTAEGRGTIDDLDELAGKVCNENPKIVADIRGGKQAALQALIGKIMKATKGRANPQKAAEALRKILG